MLLLLRQISADIGCLQSRGQTCLLSCRALCCAWAAWSPLRALSDSRQAFGDTDMELEKESKGAAAESGVAFDALEREFQEVGVGCLVASHCWSHAEARTWE